MKKKVAVILAGCGHLDGSEITESVSALIALSEHAVEVTIFAPSTDYVVVDHVHRKAVHETRNSLIEAARIARGQVRDLNGLDADDFDAVVLPGGYGAAKILSTWATEGAKCKVLSKLDEVLRDFHKQSKPIGAICIAPALVARVLGREKVSVTIGTDRETAHEIEKTGAQHVECSAEDYVTDRENKVVTTPAYMSATGPSQVFKGIRGLINELVEMA